MLRLAFDFIITWRETRTRPNAYGLGVEFGKILVGLDTQLGFCKVMDGDAPHNANIGITLGYKF